jgi:DNA-binding transcriptional ArsR family regulator
MKPYTAQADVLKALAHPVRLHIVEILAQGEACVCHLVAILKQRQPYISQHLMILREAGWVLDRREGTVVYYRLAGPQVTEIVALARGFLQAQGIAVVAPDVPASPVDGCPCPKCTGGETCP